LRTAAERDAPSGGQADATSHGVEPWLIAVVETALIRCPEERSDDGPLPQRERSLAADPPRPERKTELDQGSASALRSE
jgi:hypothetical protein